MVQKRLIFVTFLISSSTISYADNQLFQNLDNQISIGYGYTSINAYNPKGSLPNQTTTTDSIDLHVEQLFNTNVWLGLDGSFIYSATQSSSNYGFLNSIQSYGLPANATGKIGYSFNYPSIGLQVIPYLTSGIVLNYNGVTLPNSGFINSYYILYGGGARLEYVIIPPLSIYFDQTIGYLSDQGGSNINLSAMDYNSALGIKYNVASHIQLGLEGNINQITATGQTIGYDAATATNRNSAQTSYGGIFSVAYLFDNTGNYNLHNYFNPLLAKFDNSYSVGYGFASATNEYSGGSLSTINSSLSFLNIDFTHLFDNNVWAKINGSIITGMTQSNTVSGTVSQNTPTYLGFPGSALGSVGYAFVLPNTDVQLIPYINGGVDGNINSYNASQSTSISYVLSHDYFIQYGVGGRAEHAVNQYWLLYFDQLFAGLDDRSSMGLNAWRSTSTLGTQLRVTDAVNLGLSGFYDIINPTSTTYDTSANINYAAKQNTYGGLFSVGVNY